MDVGLEDSLIHMSDACITAIPRHMMISPQISTSRLDREVTQ
jgi:hypothetical protein